MTEKVFGSYSKERSSPADMAGFDALAKLALDMRSGWNHATDRVWRQLDCRAVAAYCDLQKTEFTAPRSEAAPAPVDTPEAWDMRTVLSVSTVLGLMGVISAFGLFYLGERVFQKVRPMPDHARQNDRDFDHPRNRSPKI